MDTHTPPQDPMRAAMRAAERAVAEYRWRVEMRRMALASIDLVEVEAAEGDAEQAPPPSTLN
jgi:hypothetical protein